jgi:hypothetical protein
MKTSRILPEIAGNITVYKPAKIGNFLLGLRWDVSRGPLSDRIAARGLQYRGESRWMERIVVKHPYNSYNTYFSDQCVCGILMYHA